MMENDAGQTEGERPGMLTCVPGGSNLGLWNAVLVVLGVAKIADLQQRPLAAVKQCVLQLYVSVDDTLHSIIHVVSDYADGTQFRYKSARRLRCRHQYPVVRAPSQRLTVTQQPHLECKGYFCSFGGQGEALLNSRATG